MGIVCLTSEITSLSILCAVLATHSPVKTLLADGVDGVGLGSVEQLPFFRFFASLFGHATFFPKKEDKGFVLLLTLPSPQASLLRVFEFSSLLFRIRDRNALTKKAWEDAMQGLGNV